MTIADSAAVRDELVGILRNEMFVTKDPIEDRDELIADLGLDSANIAIGLVVIEQQIGVVLTHSEVAECFTFGALVALTADALTPDFAT